MAIPEIPNNVTPLELPLPWEPHERIRTTNKYSREHWREWVEAEENGWDRRDYINLVQQQYIITGGASEAAHHAVTWLHWHRDAEWHEIAEVIKKDPRISHDDLIASFEAEVLEIEPGNTWYEHPASFGGGEYPTKLVAAMAGLTAEQYADHIEKTRPHKTGKAAIRSGEWLAFVGVRDDRYPETVLVGEVTRLSKMGLVVLESTLSAYEAGRNEAHKTDEES